MREMRDRKREDLPACAAVGICGLTRNALRKMSS